MRNGHQHALAGQQARQFGDLCRRQTTKGGGPVRVFGLPVLAAHQIVFKAFPAVAELGQEGSVMPAVGDHVMYQSQHQRHIGAGHGLHPLRVGVRRKVAGQGADVDKAATARGGLAHGFAFDVTADAAAGHS
ncbi:hypothetical protein D3C87_1705670 [compost metagenome]